MICIFLEEIERNYILQHHIQPNQVLQIPILNMPTIITFIAQLYKVQLREVQLFKQLKT